LDRIGRAVGYSPEEPVRALENRWVLEAGVSVGIRGDAEPVGIAAERPRQRDVGMDHLTRVVVRTQRQWGNHIENRRGRKRTPGFGTSRGAGRGTSGAEPRHPGLENLGART